jgi:hypothetical protein
MNAISYIPQVQSVDAPFRRGRAASPIPYLLDIDGLTPTCEFIRHIFIHYRAQTRHVMCHKLLQLPTEHLLLRMPNSPPLSIEGPMCTLCPRGEAVRDTNRTQTGRYQALPLRCVVRPRKQPRRCRYPFQSGSSLCGCEALSLV